MSIVQDNYDIPDDIVKGIASGLYKRYGSIIRYASGPNNGQILKHLIPVDFEVEEQAKGIISKTLRLVKEHKKGVFITVGGIGLISGITWIYNKANNYEPKVVTEFHTSLGAYIEAIRSGDMEMKKIKSLMNSLDKLKTHKNYKNISIQLKLEELEILVGRIYNYTIKLANDNNVELTDDEMKKIKKDGDLIINLQSYLKVQERIFDEAS